jgi:hypothetical protein
MFWFHSVNVVAMQGRILQTNAGYCGPYVFVWAASPAYNLSS